MADTKKILVIKLGALGDFIQALGPMRSIREHHPDADITLLTTAPYESLGRACGYFNHVLSDERPRWHNVRGWVELRGKLNGGCYERVYDLQNNDRTALYLKLFNPKPEWVGAAKGASHCNNSPLRTAGHALEGHKQTLSLAGINNITIDDLSWIKGDTAHLELPHPYILLVPGSDPGRPEKRWPARYYGALARHLHGWGYAPVIIGTVAEQDAAAEICRVFPQAIDITGKTALFDIVLLAREAAAAFGNDTGPMHFIAPTGCPSYVLFSRHSNPAKHAPRGPRVKTFQKDSLEELTPEILTGELKARDFRA